MNLFWHAISSLERGLNYSTTKGQVISQNVANVDTPNYKAKGVSFKEVFEDVKTAGLNAYKTDDKPYRF